jgi:hypothetical protein
MTKDKLPPTEHLEWVIKGRAQNQSAECGVPTACGAPTASFRSIN